MKSIQNYSALLQNLRNIKRESNQTSTELTNIRLVPYELPVIYSLEVEEETLCQMQKRLGIIKKRMFPTDREAISLDWKQVGGDINNVLCRHRGCFVEKYK